MGLLGTLSTCVAVATGAAVGAAGAAVTVAVLPVSVPVFLAAGFVGGAAAVGGITTGVVAWGISSAFKGEPKRQNHNIEKLESQLARASPAQSDPTDTKSRGLGPDVSIASSDTTDSQVTCVDDSTGDKWDTAITTDTAENEHGDKAPKRTHTSKITSEDYERIQMKLGIQPNCKAIHIAVAGTPGTGKSSLINALRGLRDTDPLAARTGVTECTRKIERFPDQRYPWIVWFDIPGGGTTESPMAGYFERQGLMVMDCIVLLWGDRFSELDVAILKGAQHWEIPVLVVRSKSDSHIRNMALAVCDDPENEESINRCLAEKRAEYIEQSRASIEDNLRNVKLHIPADNCFLVSAYKIRPLMTTGITQPLETAATGDSVGYGVAISKTWDHFRVTLQKYKYARQVGSNSLAGSIDEEKLLEKIFLSIAESRY